MYSTSGVGRMAKLIVGAFRVHRVSGTWKLLLSALSEGESGGVARRNHFEFWALFWTCFTAYKQNATVCYE